MVRDRVSMMMIVGILSGLFFICSCGGGSNETTGGSNETKSNLNIKTTISTDKDVYKIGESIILILKVENFGDKSFTFLPWGTPLENRFTGDCLKVSCDGEEVMYTGIMVKRIPPTEDDYLTLKTGDIATGSVDILDGYKLPDRGIYEIQFKGTYKGLPESNTLKFEVK